MPFSVTASASTIYAYMLLVPLILFLVMKYRHAKPHYTYLEMACLYAYILTLFVPVSVCAICY